MENQKQIISLSISLILFNNVLFSQGPPPPPPPPGLPIDNGLYFLLLLAVIYGLKKIIGHKKLIN